MGARNALAVDVRQGTEKLARPRQRRSVPNAYAIRVPANYAENVRPLFPQKVPTLFVHEVARQSLERRLTAASTGPVVLSITDNRHAMISHRYDKGVLRARVHHMFLGSPRPIVDALVRYVVQGDRDASSIVGRFIDRQSARIAKGPGFTKVKTRGKHHDLATIFDELNRRYFDGRVSALCTWGRRVKRRGTKPRDSIKLGTYSGAEQLIRVHPALDRSWVPRYFVAAVLYHEMLHHVVPPVAVRGRVRVHPPEFEARELLFHHHERSREWERRHIGRILRTA
jgi:hypothetical protein